MVVVAVLLGAGAGVNEEEEEEADMSCISKSSSAIVPVVLEVVEFADVVVDVEFDVEGVHSM